MQVELTKARIITIIDGLRSHIYNEREHAPDWKAKQEVDAKMYPYIKTVAYLQSKLKEAKGEEQSSEEASKA